MIRVMGGLTISSTLGIVVTVAEFPAMIPPIFADKIGQKKTYGIGIGSAIPGYILA